jgi:uncharacterized delta-60 repeat protein
MRTSHVLALTTLLVALVAAPAGAAVPGLLDPGFGTGGKLVVPAVTLGGQTPSSDPLVVLPDGRALTSGTVNNQFFLARWSSGFALDTSFSGDGMATASLTANDEGKAVALQPDGKIVQVGKAGNAFGVARFNTDGTLDTSFDGDGLALASFGQVFAEANAVAIQPDGKIVAAGDISGRFAIARFTAGGALDATFSADGLDRQDAAGANNVLIQPDGRILVEANTDFSAVRYNADGTLDTGFGGDGIAATVTPAVDGSCGMALQPNGRIVLAGSSGSDIALMRLNANGTPDGSFGSGGKVTVDLGGSEQGCGVLVERDGKIVYGGTTTVHPEHPGFDSDFAIVRLEADGDPDPTFGGDGSVTTDFGHSELQCCKLTTGLAGRIVAAGKSADLNPGGVTSAVVARYHAFDCGSVAASQVGTTGADTLTGVSRGTVLARGDVITGLAGADTIDGSDAGDSLCGDDGNDTIDGGGGQDRLFGGDGDDSIDARDGEPDRSISCGAGFRDELLLDLTDPAPKGAFLDCEITRRFALDDGPPGIATAARIGRRGHATVRIACPRGARVSCRGRLTLVDPRHASRTVARARYRVPLGASRSVAVRLPRAARGLRRFTARTVERGVSKKGPRSAARLLRPRR